MALAFVPLVRLSMFVMAICGFIRNGVNDNVTVFGCNGNIRNVTFSLPVTRSLETNYTCRILYGYNGTVFEGESSTVKLSVHVAPEDPIISPENLMFSEGAIEKISCSSAYGHPSAALILKITNEKSGLILYATGIEFVSLERRITWDYHQAVVACTVTNHPRTVMTSKKVVVNFAPENPNITPEELVFNEGITALINCSAWRGRPPADLTIWITSNRTGLNDTATAKESVSIERNITWEYHQATVTCTVTNHQLPLAIVSRKIAVHYINAKEKIVRTLATGTTTILNCSSYVESNPAPTFRWSVTKEFASAEGPIYTVSAAANGRPFVCIAANSCTGTSVTIIFLLVETAVTSVPDASSEHSPDETILVKVLPSVGAALLLAVSTVVVFIILRQRKHRKRVPKIGSSIGSNNSTKSKNLRNNNKELKVESVEYYEDIENYGSSRKPQYELLTLQRENEGTYTSIYTTGHVSAVTEVHMHSQHAYAELIP